MHGSNSLLKPLQYAEKHICIIDFWIFIKYLFRIKAYSLNILIKDFYIYRPRIEMPQNNPTKYPDHNVILEFRYSQNEKVPFESRRNIFADDWRRHCTH